MKNRLFYKIFGSYLIIVTLTLVVLGALVLGKISHDMTESIEENILSYARIIAVMPVGDIAPRVSDLGRQSSSRITFIDPTGRVVADSESDPATMDNHLNRAEIQEAGFKGQGKSVRYSHTLDVDMLYVALPVRRGQQLAGYIRLARPLYEIRHATDRLYQSVTQAVALIILPLLVLAFVYARRITSPIRRIEAFTRKVGQGDLSGTLMITGSDEIGQLAKSINQMVMQQQDRIRAAIEASRKLEAAFSSMTEGVLILDSHNRIEYVNDGMERLLRQQFTVSVGQTPLEAFRNVALQAALDIARETGLPVHQEITLTGELPIILEVNISPIPAHAEREVKIMMVFHDMTRVKNLERMRVDFVANVTHEIKTPLTAITGFIETLLAGALEERETAVQFLQTIADNAQRLNRLVDDLIILSRIELGEMRLHYENITLGAVVKDAIAIIEAKAREKNIAVHSEVSPSLPPVRADRDKVTQILLNVLDNAVKFTPESGQVRISAALEDDHHALVRITDTGIGIPKQELPKLGERFYRVDKTRSRQLGGTGLGLSIVRHLLKAHKGWMEIDSAPGKGTTVCLHFPFNPETGGEYEGDIKAPVA